MEYHGGKLDVYATLSCVRHYSRDHAPVDITLQNISSGEVAVPGPLATWPDDIFCMVVGVELPDPTGLQCQNTFGRIVTPVHT